MNYDEHLLDQQNSIDSMSNNVEKLWLVVEDKKEIIWSGGWQAYAEDVYRAAKANTGNRQFECGWVWENEFCADFEYVYSLFNPIKL